MFSVSHTTPKKALSHLRRLQEEGDGMLGEAEIGAHAEGVWSDRVFRYLKKISVDPNTFERLMWNDVVTLPPPEEYHPRKTADLWGQAVKRQLRSPNPAPIATNMT